MSFRICFFLPLERMVATEHLIVGLGNPGAEYLNTRHNVGFIVVDELASRWGGDFSTGKWQAFSLRTSLDGMRVHLLKPTTYMNLSGQVVVRYADFYKIPVGNILVIHDDLDMAPGRLKLVNGGGAGGHNGVRSLIQFLSTRDFPRLKIGIGRPGKGEIHPDMAVERFVLSPMTEDERRLLGDRMDVIEEGVRLFFDKGPASAMNLVNSVK